MNSARRRSLAEDLQARYGVSDRRSCRVLRFAHATHRHEPLKGNDEELRRRIREQAAARTRFGYRRLGVLLRREGRLINTKKVYRIYREEGLAVNRRKRRKRVSRSRVILPAAGAPNERRSMDFVTDWLESGNRFRAPTVVDPFTRQCPLIEVGGSMTGKKVAIALERLSSSHSLPRVISVENGSEFYSVAMDRWTYGRDLELEFIWPGSPVENAWIESFNGWLPR